MTKGKTFRLVVLKLWIRLGAPQNVDLAIAGKPVKSPVGTQDVLMTPASSPPPDNISLLTAVGFVSRASTSIFRRLLSA